LENVRLRKRRSRRRRGRRSRRGEERNITKGEGIMKLDKGGQ
jgi:hypothetical protein